MPRATCGKESSLLPLLLTSAKLHLPFCFADYGSKSRHKLASQDNGENQRQPTLQQYTGQRKLYSVSSMATASFLPLLPLGALCE